MRVGIIQSSYIPWRGYFDFIAQVDLFLLFDDVQIGSSRSWRNRNAIKTRYGIKWLTVPLKKHTRSQLIMHTSIDWNSSWPADHLNRFAESYRDCPYFQDAFALFQEGLRSSEGTLSNVNANLIALVCEYLDIRTPCRQASQFGATGTKTERLLDLLRKVGASTYLSGPSAVDYLEPHLFDVSGIGLEYKTYDYPVYPQRWGEFTDSVTVLDLIANCGRESRAFLTSTTPSVVAVPARARC